MLSQFQGLTWRQQLESHMLTANCLRALMAVQPPMMATAAGTATENTGEG